MKHFARFFRWALHNFSFTRLHTRLLFLMALVTAPALGLTLISGLEERRTAAMDVQASALQSARLLATNHDLMIEPAIGLTLPAGASMTLVNDKGLILARFPDSAQWVGLSALETPLMEAILSRQGEGVIETIGLDGVRRLFIFTPFQADGQEQQTFLSIGIPTQEAYAKADQRLLRNLIGLGIVTIFAFLSAWIGSNQLIIKPVEVLLAATQQVKAGHFQTRTFLPAGASELRQLARAFDQMTAELAARESENKRLMDDLQYMAITDSLTEVNNRRQFMLLAEHEFKHKRRSNHPISVLMADIDHFKQINDTYGHAIGDQVLKTVAQTCLGNIREIDVLGRYGGDEFAIILPETDLEEACQIAERIRLHIAGLAIPIKNEFIKISLSLGVSCAKDKQDLETLIKRADAALYIAKYAGRDRVAVG